MYCTLSRNNGLDWIGSVGGQLEIDKVRTFLNEMTGEMKRSSKHFNDTLSYISSNSPCETMRKYHGANR